MNSDLLLVPGPESRLVIEDRNEPLLEKASVKPLKFRKSTPAVKRTIQSEIYPI